MRRSILLITALLTLAVCLSLPASAYKGPSRDSAAATVKNFFADLRASNLNFDNASRWDQVNEILQRLSRFIDLFQFYLDGKTTEIYSPTGMGFGDHNIFKVVNRSDVGIIRIMTDHTKLVRIGNVKRYRANALGGAPPTSYNLLFAKVTVQYEGVFQDLAFNDSNVATTSKSLLQTFILCNTYYVDGSCIQGKWRIVGVDDGDTTRPADL